MSKHSGLTLRSRRTRAKAARAPHRERLGCMSAKRIKVTFAESVDADLLESFIGVIGMFGRTYQDHEARVLIVLPNPARVSLLKQQLDAWVQDGALSWSDAT